MRRSRKQSAVLCAMAVIVMASVFSTPSICQSPPKYQPGTIVAVQAEQAQPNDSPAHYKITLKVSNTDFVVLFTPPPGTYGVQFAVGDELLVSVGSTTITFNDMLGNSREVPILSRKVHQQK